MALQKTDPVLYVTEYTLVYEDNSRISGCGKGNGSKGNIGGRNGSALCEPDPLNPGFEVPTPKF